jgi:lipopolysaccharide export system protein LptA
MTKKPWWIFLATILFLNIGIGWAAGRMEIIAPGGGEFDLRQNVMKYHGLDSQRVEVHWLEPVPESVDLKGNEQSKDTQTSSQPKLLKAFELLVNLNQNYLVAKKEVFFKYDESTSVTCNLLEWAQGSALMKISGQAVIVYKDWIIKGDRIEGQLDKGLFTVYGPMEAANKLNILRGDKLVFDQRLGKVTVTDNALLIRGKNEMAASEIVYFLNTNQVFASGMVKTSIIDETK